MKKTVKCHGCQGGYLRSHVEPYSPPGSDMVVYYCVICHPRYKDKKSALANVILA